jgi:hypothetical protein
MLQWTRQPFFSSSSSSSCLAAAAGMAEAGGTEPRMLLSPSQIVELRQLKEDLSLAVKRAAEAFRADPTRSSHNSAIFRKAQMADQTVQALKRRIADIEGERKPPKS